MFTAKIYSYINESVVASWWNGRHKGLKIPAFIGVLVQVQSRLPQLKDKLIAVLKGIVRLSLSSGCRHMSAHNDKDINFESMLCDERLKIYQHLVIQVLQPQKS